MEFPTLGEHCQQPNCNQIDFLPIQCKCGKVFCREHFNDHCLSGDCELAPEPKEVNFKNEDKIYKCSEAGCRKGNLHEMLCAKCGKHYCIEHRFHPSCPEIDDETMAAKIEQVYFAIGKPKSPDAKTVKIIQDVDNIDYIESVTLDPDLKDTVPVFISSKWSLGRAIDSICDSCNIKNENNKMGDTKLRLFRQLDGYCISPLKMDVEICELMKQEVLLEGDKLVMEYIGSQVLTELDENDQMFLRPS
ncbi:hypothetical protein NE865_10045 [Phthorimaea operculella]|nr:hypothetical protein NE865_10045 [Phthorimaea operculella]